MRKILCIIFLFITADLIAQDIMLDLSVQRIAQTESNWDLNIILNSSMRLQPGVLIEFPNEIRIIPVSVKVNEKNYWLQNYNRIPEIDSVTTWQLTEEGLVLLFKENEVLNGNQLKVNCILTLIAKELTKEKVIRIRRVNKTVDNYEITNQVIASKNVPITLTK